MTGLPHLLVSPEAQNALTHAILVEKKVLTDIQTALQSVPVPVWAQPMVPYTSEILQVIAFLQKIQSYFPNLGS